MAAAEKKKKVLKAFAFVNSLGALHNSGEGGHPVIFMDRDKDYEDGVIRLNRLIGKELGGVVPVAIHFFRKSQ